MGYSGDIVVFLKIDELSIHHCVSYAFMAEDLHDVQNVSGFVVLHCCLPVSECVERYLSQPLALKLESYMSAL